MSLLPSSKQQLLISFFHQNSQALQKQFDIPRSQAKQIIKECPDCRALSKTPPSTGVNPRGLSSQIIWQTYVTHYAPFGIFKYVHISIDTYSGALHASALTGESAKNTQAHWLEAFSHFGQPQQLKLIMALDTLPILLRFSFSVGLSSIKQEYLTIQPVRQL